MYLIKLILTSHKLGNSDMSLVSLIHYGRTLPTGSYLGTRMVYPMPYMNDH